MEPVKIKRILTYSALYPIHNESLDEIIKSLPTTSAIQYASLILVRRNMLKVGEDEHRLFYQMFPFMEHKLANDLCNYINTHNSNQFEYIDKVAIHILLDKLLVCPNNLSANIVESKSLFSNFIRAYLMCCDIHLESIGDAVPVNLNEEEFAKIFIRESLKYHDLSSFKDFRFEMLKLCYFIKYVLNNPSICNWVDLYLQERGIKRWDYYPLFLIKHFIPLILHEEGATCNFEIESKDYYAYQLIKAMVVPDEEYRQSSDFVGLRTYPIYQISELKFTIMSVNFFIDKFFQSFLFDFSKVLTAHQFITGIKSYSHLKSILGSDFIEHEFFYKIMKGCFPTYRPQTGQELKSLVEDGEPDFLLRHGTKVFVFEFKDILLDASTKHCGDFDRILNELKEQFVLSTIDKQTGKKKKKSKDKGIRQLLACISNKLPILLKNITSINGFTIYPIIVYTDRNLDIEGINYFLNKELETIKGSYDISNEYDVKPLVLLPLEELTLLEDYFKSGKLDLKQLIPNYYKEDKMLSFKKFLLREAKKLGYNFERSSRFQLLLDELNSIDKCQ